MSRKIVITVLVFSLLLMSGCTVYPEKKVSILQNATGLEQYERLKWESLKAKQWADLEAHFASNFVFLGADGAKNKQQAMEALRASEITDYTLGDLEVTAQGNTAIVTYTLTVKGTMHGKPMSEAPTRVMSVWQQQKSGWVQIAESETSLSPAP